MEARTKSSSSTTNTVGAAAGVIQVLFRILTLCDVLARDKITGSCATYTGHVLVRVALIKSVFTKKLMQNIIAQESQPGRYLGRSSIGLSQ
jgi:hypothetical protein